MFSSDERETLEVGPQEQTMVSSSLESDIAGM